ncbi:MAG: efflux RND transporter permease subunit [Bacteroidales bacterium]|nr:efflux RND transporter permease subunit [Candidatus Cacconaster merdequi]
MKRKKPLSGWVDFAIENKKLVYIAVLAFTVIGGIGLIRMNKDEFPTFELKQGLVAGIYPGADAEEVEQQLTGRLEDILFSFKEVDRNSLRSVTKDGICYIYVDLNCSQSKKDQVWAKIKLKLQAEKAMLPAGVLAVAVLDDFSSISSLLVALESDDKSYAELKSYADELCTKLRRLPNLAKASIIGEQKEEIAVTLDKEKIAGYALDPAAMFLKYQSSSLAVPAGSFETGYVSAPLRVSNPASTEMGLAEHIVYSDPSGEVVRLKDVSQIERRYKEPDSYVSYNGHACLIVSIEMRPDNNIVDFGKEVDGVLTDFMADMPDSVTISRISDQPKVVGDSVYSFLRDLMISMLVVIFVMLLLFPMKSALIAGSGVPICTAISIGVMYLTGIDLNTVTLGALIATLGMIVDNSIITMDGYMGKLKYKELTRREAAGKSIKELFPPTLAATLAISAMFFPAKYIITGYLGDFISSFPWVFVITLLVSLIYAVTVVPSLEVKYITTEKPVGNNLLSRTQNIFFQGMENAYAKAESFCFKHPGGTLLCALLTVALGIFLFFQLNIQMMPMAARDFFVVETEVEGGNGLKQTKACTDSLQRIFLADERVESVTAFVGTGAPRFCVTYNPILPGKTVSQMIVNTKSKKATENILQEYEEKYAHIFPNALVRFKQIDYQAVDAPVVITLKGEDRNELLSAAEKIKKQMCSMTDELKWVHSTSDNFVPSVRIDLDDDEAARLGVNKSLLSLSLAGNFNGENIATVWEGDNSVPVNLYSYGLTDEMNYETVGNTMVSTMMPGVSVPLRQVAAITPEWSAVMLEKRSGEESVSIFADMKYGKSQPVAVKKIKRFIKDNIELPEGSTIEYKGLTETNELVAPQILLAFISAILILFIFLLFHFKKARLSALTLVMSSLCLFGASLGLFIFKLDFGLTAVLGLISLVGIIVRNGIILFEYAEELHYVEGLSVKEAAMKAGAMRMRPIFLTSCTTALGVLPMVIGGDMLWQPMGVVICFGTLLSIFLIVLIMPVSYWQLFKNNDNKEPDLNYDKA